MTIFFDYIFIGIVAGTFAGLLGVGGGIFVVPALALVFRLQGFPDEYLMQLAVGTSLAAMIISSIASIISHYRRGAEIKNTYKQIVIGIIVGTIGGAFLASLIDTNLLRLLFGVMLLLVALVMFFNVQEKPHQPLPALWKMQLAGFTIGVPSGLLGLGGGIITVPLLSYFSVPMRNIVGISAATSLTIATIGTCSYMLVGLHKISLPWSVGFVYWPAVIAIGIASPFFAYMGAHISHRLPIKLLKRIFAILLALVGLRMVI